MEIHHIVEVSEGGDDDPSNAIPLCFDCHADMRSYDHKHPKGNKYTRKELERHRDNWIEKVAGNIGVVNREETIATDTHVYRHIICLLPWNGSVGFIRANNFNGFHFKPEVLDQFHKFEHELQNPAFQFLDPDLEGLLARLTKHIDDFMLTIAQETFAVGEGWNAVPDDWLETNPSRFKKAVEDLHSHARLTVEAYDTLVQTATRKLGVLPASMIAEPEAKRAN